MGDGGRFRRLAAEPLAGRRVLAPDLRGHGRSGWEPPWDLGTHLDDLRETLDAEGAGRADLVGFSFGGRLALELAAADPGRVARLALLDPAVPLAPAVAATSADDARHDLSFPDEDAAVRARVAVLRHAPAALIEADLRGTLVTGEDGRLRYRMAPAAVVAAYGEMARAPGLPADTPTVLVRAADGIVDDRQEGLLRDALGDALWVTRVPGAHAVMWDAYEATAGAVARHLAM
jgi:lipase